MKIISVFYLLFCATVVFAQTTFTPISNLHQVTGGDNIDIVDGQTVGVSFTTYTTAFYFFRVSILIDGSNPGSDCPSFGTFTVALHSDAGGSPGNLIETLSGNNYPTNAGLYAYTTAIALEMPTNTTYWIVVSNSDTTGRSAYKWSTESSARLDSGSIWALGVDKTSVNGGGWNLLSGSFSTFSVTAATQLLPTISISSSVVLTYPATPIPCTLQVNSNLITTNWVTVTNAILGGTVSNQTFFILPPTAPHMYYRLNLTP